MMENRKVKVMVVDDSVFIHIAVKKSLVPAGYEICGCFTDGVQAIENYGTHLPDLLIMDNNMPNMNGLPAAKEIADRYPEARIMILSAADDATKVEGSPGVGCFMPKPFTSEKLLERVNQFLAL